MPPPECSALPWPRCVRKDEDCSATKWNAGTAARSCSTSVRPEQDTELALGCLARSQALCHEHHPMNSSGNQLAVHGLSKGRKPSSPSTSSLPGCSSRCGAWGVKAGGTVRTELGTVGADQYQAWLFLEQQVHCVCPRQPVFPLAWDPLLWKCTKQNPAAPLEARPCPSHGLNTSKPCPFPLDSTFPAQPSAGQKLLPSYILSSPGGLGAGGLGIGGLGIGGLGAGK